MLQRGGEKEAKSKSERGKGRKRKERKKKKIEKRGQRKMIKKSGGEKG